MEERRDRKGDQEIGTCAASVRANLSQDSGPLVLRAQEPLAKLQQVLNLLPTIGGTLPYVGCEGEGEGEGRGGRGGGERKVGVVRCIRI